MGLTQSQRGVRRGMAAGLAVSGAMLGVIALLRPAGAVCGVSMTPSHAAALAAIAPVATLAVCVGRLAAHRFVTPEDIDGSGLAAGTGRARLLQSLLQNTLEQLALALPVYAAWCLLMPAGLAELVLVASSLFLCGRVLFFWGYRRGAAGRAFGFALTFYPTVVLLGWLIVSFARGGVAAPG